MQSQCLPAMVPRFGSADYGFVSVAPGMLNIYGKCGGMAVSVFLFPVCVWYRLTHSWILTLLSQAVKMLVNSFYKTE